MALCVVRQQCSNPALGLTSHKQSADLSASMSPPARTLSSQPHGEDSDQVCQTEQGPLPFWLSTPHGAHDGASVLRCTPPTPGL